MRVPFGEEFPYSWLLLGNILHFAYCGFVVEIQIHLTAKTIFCSPSTVNQARESINEARVTAYFSMAIGFRGEMAEGLGHGSIVLSKNRIRFPWDSGGFLERRIPGKNGNGRYP